MEERARRRERRARFVKPCPFSATPRAFPIYADEAGLRRLRATPTAISASAINTTIQIGKPVKGSVPLPVAPVALSTPDPVCTRPLCPLTTGLELTDVLGSAAGVGTLGVLLTFGPCDGSPGLPGSGVGFGRGVGGDGGSEPQDLPRFPLRAWTSTS